ncbi:neurofilament heavy polypeptide-like isoform X2 [Macrobrachium rosenbergii]|uniref:neurofilament heavy polypeptide-like isoform X2 n=1 Tax=Macrobrachium rosenbergii TaxID=79674 RepID=UPI0034D7A35D
MDDSENIREDLNPWELARNMSLASSQSTSGGLKGSCALRKASNFNSVFAKAGSKERGPFQRASIVDGDPFVLSTENEIYLENEKAAFHSTTSTKKAEQGDFATDSFEQTGLTNGRGKNITDFGKTTTPSVFSKASSLEPVLKEGQSESGSVPDAKIILDELNCSPLNKLNTFHGETKERDFSSVDTPKTVVPAVKKVPVFGGRKTQIAKGDLDKEENSVPKKIPKFSSSVIKKAPPFAPSHSVLGFKGKGGNKITGRQLLRPSFQDNQINSDVKKSVLETSENDKVETESLRKYQHETVSGDKGKERMKEPQSEISYKTNKSETMKTSHCESLSTTEKKENAKTLTFKTASGSYKNKLEEMVKAKTPIKTDKKPSVKAAASSKTKVEGKCKASKFQLLSKIDAKKSIKDPEVIRPLKLACHDKKESKSSSSLSEQKLGKTTNVCDDEQNNKLCDLENEDTDISVDGSIELESNRMGEGIGHREIDLEVPLDRKIPDFETDWSSSDSQKQDLTKEMNNKNAEESETVLFNLDASSTQKKDKKSELKTKSADLENGNAAVKKVDNKWDKFFSEVISQVMNKDVNAEERKEFQAKSRNVMKSHKFKEAAKKRNCWSKDTLRFDENIKKRLRSKKEAVASDQKLSPQLSSGSDASEHYDSPRTLAYKKELFHIVERTYDSWVQCDTCSKWRKLPPNIDPASLPPKWFCELNHNENQNVCSAPEDDWNKENVYVYNGYILGSVVWARVTGTDWWPAMVDIDPDFQIHNWLDNSAKNVKYYHVTFFEEPVSRGWVLSKNVMKFRTTDTHDRFLAVSSKDSSNMFSLKSCAAGPQCHEHEFGRAKEEVHISLQVPWHNRKEKHMYIKYSF